MEVSVKNELFPYRYIKSFHHRDFHYVFIAGQGRRRILNIKDLTQESQHLVLKPLSKSLDEYM